MNNIKNIQELSLEEIIDIKIIIFDFDGVFTDNFVNIDENGKESVTCSRSDGLGLKRLKQIGIKTMILSTEKNPVVSARALKLEVNAIQGVEDKGSELINICEDNKVDIENVMYVGNDINDIPAFKIAGITVGVKNSYSEIYPYIRFLTSKNGGEGAVREVCDVIFNKLSSQRITSER